MKSGRVGEKTVNSGILTLGGFKDGKYLSLLLKIKELVTFKCSENKEKAVIAAEIQNHSCRHSERSASAGSLPKLNLCFKELKSWKYPEFKSFFHDGQFSSSLSKHI